MTARHSTARTGHRAERGQMMVVFGLTLTVFIGALMLGVDLSRLRTEAENAQRVANAAALAGVIFMPNYLDTAFYRADEEARKNGFVTGQKGVTITTAAVPGYPNRLKVTITEPVSLIFGGVLGLGAQTISRSAVAQYALPLQMGAPDNVLGYSPFPTRMVTGTVPEGFYLENKGPFEIKDKGDAYSPLFESFKWSSDGSWKHYASPTEIPNGSANPNCPPTAGTSGATSGNCSFSNGTQTTPNGDHFTGTRFNGYDYIVDDPLTNTLVIKIFNPYYEVFYSRLAHGYDSSHTDLATGCHYALAPQDSGSSGRGCAYQELGSHSTTDASGNCVISTGSNCTKLIDETGGNNQFGDHTTTLEFNLYGPGLSPYDPQMPLITATASYTTPGSTATCETTTQNCVYQAPFLGGDDPTAATCSASSCTASPYAYQFLNYAVIHGPGIFRLNVRSVANIGAGGDQAYGTNGHAYGLAVCATDLVTGTAPLTGYNPQPGDLGTTFDPYTNAGATPGWNPSSCLDPNAPVNGGQCANPNLPGPTDKCIHIYGLGKMAIHNWLIGGSSSSGTNGLVPLGFIPPGYAGKMLQIHLYDIGDIAGGGDYIEALTPAGDTTHFSGTLNGGFPSTLQYTMSAAPEGPLSGPGYTGYPIFAPATYPASTPITITDSSWNPIFEGSWLNMQVQVPSASTYTNMVNSFGGYWKMLYHIAPGASADDATTWAINVVGSPVQLVTG